MVEISNHLPPSVRDALIEASKVDASVEESQDRIEAINEVIAQARLTHPNLFRYRRDNPPLEV